MEMRIFGDGRQDIYKKFNWRWAFYNCNGAIILFFCSWPWKESGLLLQLRVIRIQIHQKFCKLKSEFDTLAQVEVF
jgi:hypothetical protein